MTSTRSSRKERKNSQFRRVFWWQLKHNRIFTVFYTVALLGGLSVGMLCFILTNLHYYTDMSNWQGVSPAEVAYFFSQQIMSDFLALVRTMVLPISILYIFCYCCNAFGYMHNRRSVDLFHALPVRRRPMLMGGYVAGLVTIYIPLALSMAAAQLICEVYHLTFPISPWLFLESFGLCALMLTACFVFTAFFLIATGTLLDTVISILATAIGWPLLCYVVNQALGQFLPGYASILPDEWYTALCPYGAAFKNFILNVYHPYSAAAAAELPFEVSPFFIVWWVCFSVFFVLAAVLCYSRRKSECAENHFSFPVIRALIRFLVSTVGGLGLASILGMMINYNSCYLAGLIIGSLTGHIVFQAIWARGFRKFWKTIPAYVLTMAISLGFLYILHEGGLGYVTRIPDPEKVVSVECSLDNLQGDDSKESYLANYAYLSLSSEDGEYWEELYPSFTKKEEIATVCALHQSLLTKYPAPYLPCTDHPGENYQSGYYVTFTYTFENGKTMRRSYTVPITEEDVDILASVANVQKMETYQLYEPFYYTDSSHVDSVYVYSYTDEWEYNASNSKLTEEEKKQVWDTFVEEINSPDFSNPVVLEDYSYIPYSYAMDVVAPYSYEMDSVATTTVSDDSIYREDKSYTIDVGTIKFSELPEEIQDRLNELTPDKESPIDNVDSYMCYTVPECCEKTRALIDQLTEDYGETYYYNEE